MTLVVGFAPDGRSRAPLHLGAMLARSTGEDIVVGAVVPVPWPPGVGRVDAEYQAWLAAVGMRATPRSREASVKALRGSPPSSPRRWSARR